MENQTRRPGGNNHFANFIAAVKSRRSQDLNAEIQEGHYSAALIHLANISYRLGQEAAFNPRTRAFGDDKDANETLGRMEEHLRGNGLKLEDLRLRVGAPLAIDAHAETIRHNDEANRMLTRNYRAGFVVPDHVS